MWDFALRYYGDYREMMMGRRDLARQQKTVGRRESEVEEREKESRRREEEAKQQEKAGRQREEQRNRMEERTKRRMLEADQLLDDLKKQKTNAVEAAKVQAAAQAELDRSQAL